MQCCSLLGYPNENAVHVALKTVRKWLDKLTSQNKVSEKTILCAASKLPILVDRIVAVHLLHCVEYFVIVVSFPTFYLNQNSNASGQV